MSDFSSMQVEGGVSSLSTSAVSVEYVRLGHHLETESTRFKVMSYFVTLQAKVTEELAAATAQVSHLQLKMTAHQKKETELQVQLTESLKETDLFRSQLTKLQAELSGVSCVERAGTFTI